MAAGKVLMRDVVPSINTGTDVAPVWVPIKGLTEPVEHSPSTKRVELQDADSAGREEHMVVTRGDAFTCKGFRMEDESNGDRDAGQEACETLAKQIGTASLKQFKIESPGGDGIVFTASAQVKLYGGNESDAAPWECELTVSGDIAPAA
jgi:hypothetical protein